MTGQPHLLAFALMLAAFALGPAAAQPPPDLATGVTDEAISVASDYQGARLTVFGVHWRTTRAPQDIVVVLQGPAEERVVRRKRRIAGMWMLSDPARFNSAPSFFALASTRPVTEFLSPSDIWTYGLDPGALARQDPDTRTPPDSDPATYRQALVRLMRKQKLYVEMVDPLEVAENGAFKVPFRIPANAPIGEYEVRVYLFRNGRLVRQEHSDIVVSRIGIEKAIYTMAQTRPALYGLAAVLSAVAFGSLAYFGLRRR